MGVTNIYMIIIPSGSLIWIHLRPTHKSQALTNHWAILYILTKSHESGTYKPLGYLVHLDPLTWVRHLQTTGLSCTSWPTHMSQALTNHWAILYILTKSHESGTYKPLGYLVHLDQALTKNWAILYLLTNSHESGTYKPLGYLVHLDQLTWVRHLQTTGLSCTSWPTHMSQALTNHWAILYLLTRHLQTTGLSCTFWPTHMSQALTNHWAILYLLTNSHESGTYKPLGYLVPFDYHKWNVLKEGMLYLTTL